MKTLRTRAIVLRRVNYGEADRIIHLITPEGRLNVMARGVRREKSKLAGGIELFAVSDIVAGQGKGDLGVLTSARLVQFYRHILEDYDKTVFGYEILKQVSKASDAVNEPGWYDIATEVLMGLDAKTVPLELVQLWFYLQMSAMLGHELNTTYDYQGKKLQVDMWYRYDQSEKGFVSTQTRDITAEHIKILRLASQKPLQAIVQVGGMAPYLPECLYVARMHAAL